jgi:hypothetical protein
MMKKLLLLMTFGALLMAAGGCHIGECWREAWRSRLCPQQQQQAVIYADPCVTADPCGSPCGSPCGVTTTTPVIAPGPATR